MKVRDLFQKYKGKDEIPIIADIKDESKILLSIKKIKNYDFGREGYTAIMDLMGCGIESWPLTGSYEINHVIVVWLDFSKAKKRSYKVLER